MLEHRTPCLAFAVQETAHVNVWKNKLAELGLPVGPWLRPFKRALLDGRPDDPPIEVGPAGRTMPLGALRATATVTPGQKIGYVTDVADTAANRHAIVGLVRNADLLFIEAPFAAADVALAADRAHLTTAAAGSIARVAAVRRVEPFHFLPALRRRRRPPHSRSRGGVSGRGGGGGIEPSSEHATPRRRCSLFSLVGRLFSGAARAASHHRPYARRRDPSKLHSRRLISIGYREQTI